MKKTALFLLLASVAVLGETETQKWVRLLGNRGQSWTFEALNKLIELGPQVVPDVHKLYQDEKEPSIRRWQAAKVLGALKAKVAVDDLLKGVASPDVNVAACSAEALGRIGDRSVLPGLRKLRKLVRSDRVRAPLERSIAQLEGRTPVVLPGTRTTAPRDAPPEPGFDWIPWAKTIEEALVRARKERKPVLAFVTPWDATKLESGYAGATAVVNFRKDARVPRPEKDPGFVKERAMLTAFLCDPDLSDLIAREFVPIRVHLHTWHFMHRGNGPFRDPLRQLGTAATKAHAPAMIFSSAGGKLLHQATRLGVFSPLLAYRTCLAVLGREGGKPLRPGEALIRDGKYDAAADALRAVARPDARDRYHLAYAQSRLGDGAKARAIWQELANAGGRWAVRAKLHLSPDGPFPREWLSLRDFGVDARIATTESGKGGVEAAVKYLLEQQRADGSWPDPVYRWPTRGNRPRGMTVPRTAMCVSALRAWGGDGEAIARGAALVKRWCADPEKLVWQLTYALHLAVELGWKEEAARVIEAMKEIEHDGGWTYTRPDRLHTFNTAPILIGLVEARARNIPVDEKLIGRAAAFLERNRLGRKSIFHYGTAMEHMTPAGMMGDASSCFRSPLCELALHLAGTQRETDRLRKAVRIFFSGLEGARSTTKIYESYVDPTTLQDSYRYFFGTWYAARAIKLLGDAGGARRLKTRILGHQEIDGSFVDSQMTGKTSSTAFALLTLAELR